MLKIVVDTVLSLQRMRAFWKVSFILVQYNKEWGLRRRVSDSARSGSESILYIDLDSAEIAF